MNLQHPDGVLIPLGTAHRLQGLALLGAAEVQRRNSGGLLGEDLRVVLEALAVGAERHETACATAGSEVRTVSGRVGVVNRQGIPVREAAHTLGLSESYVQRLCRRGSVVASRAGWAWLVDMDSLRAVTRRTA